MCFVGKSVAVFQVGQRLTISFPFRVPFTNLSIRWKLFPLTTSSLLGRCIYSVFRVYITGYLNVVVLLMVVRINLLFTSIRSNWIKIILLIKVATVLAGDMLRKSIVYDKNTPVRAQKFNKETPK